MIAPRPREHARPPPLLALVRAATPETRAIDAAAGESLAARGDAIAEVVVIERGLVATLAVVRGGGCAETGLLGPGALVGHAALMGASTSGVDALALTRVVGLSVGVDALSRAADAHPPLRAALAGQLLERMAETERLCACAALHTVESRLADWLRRAAALCGGPVEVIHERLAIVLGVRRASVTVALHVLEGERAIACRRGRVQIRDAGRLAALACGCRP